MLSKLLFGALALTTSILAQSTSNKDGADCGACNAIYQTCMETCITDGPSFPGKHSTCNSWCFCKTADFEDCGTKCGYDESVCKGKISNGQKQRAVDDALIDIKRNARIAEMGDEVPASTTGYASTSSSTKTTSTTGHNRPHVSTCLPGIDGPCEDPRFTIPPPSVTEPISSIKTSTSTVSRRRSRPNDFSVPAFVTETPRFSASPAPVIARSPQISPRPISCIPCDKRYNTCITKNACPAGQNACTNECNCDTADYDDCGVKCWFYREACPLQPAVLKADHRIHPNTTSKGQHPHSHTWQTRTRSTAEGSPEHDKRQISGVHSPHINTSRAFSTTSKYHWPSHGGHGPVVKTSVLSSSTSKYQWPAHGGHGPVVKSSSVPKTPSSMLAQRTTATEPVETEGAISPRAENSFGTLQACPGCPGLIQRCVKIPCRGNEPEYISCVCDNLTLDCDASCWRNECRRDLSAMLPQWCASLGELPPA